MACTVQTYPKSQLSVRIDVPAFCIEPLQHILLVTLKSLSLPTLFPVTPVEALTRDRPRYSTPCIEYCAAEHKSSPQRFHDSYSRLSYFQLTSY